MTRSSLGTATNNGAASGPAATVKRAPGWRSTRCDSSPVDNTASPIRVAVTKRMSIGGTDCGAALRSYGCGTTVASGSSGVIRPARNRVGPATVDPEPLLRALANPALQGRIDLHHQGRDIGGAVSRIGQP